MLHPGADLLIQGRIVGENFLIFFLRRVPDFGEVSALRPVQAAVAGPHAGRLPQFIGLADQSLGFPDQGSVTFLRKLSGIGPHDQAAAA